MDIYIYMYIYRHIRMHHQLGFGVIYHIDFLKWWPHYPLWRYMAIKILVKNEAVACCLTAPSHYRTQCWIEITDIHPVHKHINYARYTETNIAKNIFRTLYAPVRRQWFNVSIWGFKWSRSWLRLWSCSYICHRAQLFLAGGDSKTFTSP